MVTAAGQDSLTAEVLRRYEVPPPRPSLVVVQGLPKGDRGELAVEMMTEAGVDVIVPWAASRCVTQWKGDRAAKALARWRGTAREAAKQARRFHLPEVTEQATTAAVGALSRRRRSRSCCTRRPPSRCQPPAAAGGTGRHRRVVGPEGGVTDEEIAALRAAGAVPALLGPTVLRTSTAGVAAAAVLLSRCGRW